MLFCHVVITVCACTFVTCTLIKINQSINRFDSPFLPWMMIFAQGIVKNGVWWVKERGWSPRNKPLSHYAEFSRCMSYSLGILTGWPTKCWEDCPPRLGLWNEGIVDAAITHLPISVSMINGQTVWSYSCRSFIKIGHLSWPSRSSKATRINTYDLLL